MALHGLFVRRYSTTAIADRNGRLMIDIVQMSWTEIAKGGGSDERHHPGACRFVTTSTLECGIRVRIARVE